MKAYSSLLTIVFTLLSLFASVCGSAQTDAAEKDTSRLFLFSAYGEGYILYDLSTPVEFFGGEKTDRHPFISSYNRNNTPLLNIALLQGKYISPKFKANIGLMAGTYATANMRNEPNVLRYLNEASVSFKLHKSEALWLQAGVMPSHIGFESPIGADQLNMTRSIVADNTPYFESGAKLSYEKGRWYAAALITNGWQEIVGPDSTINPSFGHQVMYTRKKWKFNSSSFIGKAYIGLPERGLRIYHNAYAQFTGEKVSAVIGFDFGFQRIPNTRQMVNWYSPVGVIAVKLSEKTRASARVEYFNDQHGLVLGNIEKARPAMLSGTLGLDFSLAPQMMWRLESRWFDARQFIYRTNNIEYDTNLSFATSLCFRF